MLTPGYSELAFLLIGIVVGYFGAYHRSRRDIAALERHAESHFKLAHEQYAMQVKQTDLSQRRIKIQEAYDQLGRWLHSLERTIDEVWFGCATEDESTRKHAKRIVDEWPWETLKVPAEFYAAGFYWSSDIRELIRKFEGASAEFTIRAAVAIDEKDSHHERYEPGSRNGRVWESRSTLLSIIDDIREAARGDLCPKEE